MMTRKPKNKELMGAGIGLAVLGGVSGNKAVSSIGGFLFGAGLVGEALSKKKSRRR